MFYRGAALFILALTCALFLSNCNGSETPVSDAAVLPGDVALRISEPDASVPLRVGEDVVDTLEVNGYDARGFRIVGPLRVPISEAMEFSTIPRGVATLKLDYLRHRGFPILRALVRLSDGSGAKAISMQSQLLEIQDPAQTPPATPPTSSFRFKTLTGSTSSNPPGVPGYQLIATYPDNSTLDNTPTDHSIMLQGVCYAPSPIGYFSSTAPALSDLFWDNFQANGNTVYGWEVLWGAISQYVPPPTVFRNDIDTIRTTLGCNAIRVYAMLSQQLDSQGTGFGTTIYTHKAFLDYCFDNGNDPIFVLITLTPPTFAFQAQVTPSPPLASAWQTNVTQMVGEVGPNAAVLGFLVMNELDQDGSAFNLDAQGNPAAANTDTDFFYNATASYIQLCKAPFPGKLVGWAAHDNPQLLSYMVNYGNTQTNVTYAEQIGVSSPSASPSPTYGFDFWGVNTYQAATLDSVLGPQSISNGLTFAQLPTAYQKPVIFTEIGYPAAKHETDDGPLSESTTAQERAAEVLTRVYTEAYSNAAPPSPNPSFSPNPPDYNQASTLISVPYPQLLVGAFYFEYSDEWNKGGNGSVDANGDWAWNANSTQDSNRPNGWDDEAAFGLYSSALGSGVAANRDPYPPNSGGPSAPVDTLTARSSLVTAISSFYNQNFVNPGTPASPAP